MCHRCLCSETPLRGVQSPFVFEHGYSDAVFVGTLDRPDGVPVGVAAAVYVFGFMKWTVARQ